MQLGRLLVNAMQGNQNWMLQTVLTKLCMFDIIYILWDNAIINITNWEDKK